MIELSDHRYQRLRIRILLVSLPESLWRPLSSFTTLSRFTRPNKPFIKGFETLCEFPQYFYQYG